MPTISNYMRTRIESLYQQTLHPAEMFKLLKGEDLKVSFTTVTCIIKKLKLIGIHQGRHEYWKTQRVKY